MENADIILRKLHNNEIDDVPIEEGNIIFDKDTKQMLVDDEDNGVGKRLKYGGSEKLIDVILTANTTTKTVYDDTITTDSIIRIYVDEEDSSFTYNSLSTSNGSVTITFNAMTQDVPIKVGIGAVSEFHQLITEGQASDISYNNSHSGMVATDVQDAIDELKSDLGNIELTADNVEYDNTTSGLQATNVQGAVDEISDNLTQIAWRDNTATTLEALINGFVNSSLNTLKLGQTKFIRVDNRNDLWFDVTITKDIGGDVYTGTALSLTDATVRYTFRKPVSGGASTVVSPFSKKEILIPRWYCFHQGNTSGDHYASGDLAIYSDKYTTLTIDNVSFAGDSPKLTIKDENNVTIYSRTSGGSNLIIDISNRTTIKLYVEAHGYGSSGGHPTCTLTNIRLT